MIGHQWTNIVLILNGILIPLRPMPFYTQRYCLDHDLVYVTEHERVVDYLSHLNLDDYLGSHRSRDVVVLADSGYDNKKIGSSPRLRLAHRIENRETRVDIDPCRIPRKMREKPMTPQEEPDAWILSVSRLGSNCQNSA